MKAKIISTGSFSPEKVLTNADLEKIVDTTDQWITDRTGIKERRIASENQCASDLGYEAAISALNAAGLKPEDLDMIIVATVTGDMLLPSTACVLQAKLGAFNAVAFDINAACSGFIFGLSTACSYINAGSYKKIMVIGVECLSKFTDWDDRTTCVLFGDGAGAVILEPSGDDSGILSTDIYSDGSYAELLYVPGGGSKKPASEETLKEGDHYIKMKGNEVFKIAVKTLENLVINTLKKNNVDPSELSLLIPHQANMRIIQATAKRLGLTPERVFVNIEKYGNTSAASVAIALDEAVKTGRIKKGDYVLLEAFGAGLTWASALIKW
ncbi:MAG: beta-ketoacyl-ACP synthase III [Dissulfurispiraceae bacterium]|jgi:3-oxoacyl-[acyl-carrier-protein] synthase-3|nr:beta-ketoacyl-ACP synthase III [Dissulfurispiraceae bacterium]